MAEPTKKSLERLKEQPKDDTKKTQESKVQLNKCSNEMKKSPEIKVHSKIELKKTFVKKIQPKDETKKTPEIKVQLVKSVKEPADSTKTRISRNVAINRSFNANSKLELLR